MSDKLPPTGPWVPSDHSDGPSEWDQEEAEGFVGLMALVGVTYLAADGKTVKSQAQYYGRVVSVDQIKGIVIACEGRWAGSIMTLPPALRSFQYARPGQYKLHSTGETVENPDLTTFFSVTEPSKS